MAESAFNTPEAENEVEELREFLKEMEKTVAAGTMKTLRQKLNSAFEEEFNVAYIQGVNDAESRTSDPDEESRLRAEAKGLAWALTAVKGMPVSPLNNAYANPNVVKGLLAFGEANKR